MGKRIIETRLNRSVTVREENAIAALEVMSRFSADPRWLVYLPPTMAPPATTERAGLLEHPDEVFKYFAGDGVGQVVCEEKHMGFSCRGRGLSRPQSRGPAVPRRRPARQGQ